MRQTTSDQGRAGANNEIVLRLDVPARPKPPRRLLEPTWRASSRRSPAVIRGVLKRPPVIDELHAITLPAIVIVGDEDAPIPPDKAQRLANAIPGAGFEVVAGAGHSSSVEQPSAVTALIAGFLDQLPR
jgi:pimeloyl-ACP methyl ester carboxylesterase